MATGATEDHEDDTDVSLDLARQFAKEKNLQLISCDVEDGDKVETAFTTLIDIIMSDILPPSLGGQKLPNLSLSLSLCHTHTHTHTNTRIHTHSHSLSLSLSPPNVTWPYSSLQKAFNSVHRVVVEEVAMDEVNAVILMIN